MISEIMHPADRGIGVDIEVLLIAGITSIVMSWAGA